jgi:hypothetical protein
MLIGALTVSGQQLGSDGELTIVVGDQEGDNLTAGRIRVNGNVTATGFTFDQGIDITAGSVEVNAATGSINITGSNNTISGYLELEGDRVHIASDEILLKLRENPQYTGYVQELNAPATVQRPEGVVRAAAVQLEGNKSILVQNTGTRQTPAGVFAGFDPNDDEGTEIGGEDPQPGGLDIVFNGQLQRPDGTILTGRQAFDVALAAAKADLDPGETFGTDLVAGSTFNGCVILSGSCGGGSDSDPVKAISSEIKLVTNATLDDSPVAPMADDMDEGDAGDGQDDEEDESDEGSSPIEPPMPLINTRALDGDVDVTDPVSGSGNPALIGSPVDAAAAGAATSNGDEQ